MLDAVSVVEAYLRVNGFLTVSEYPIIHRREGGRFREITDVDILGIRLPQAGRVLPRPHPEARNKTPNDPALDLRWGRRELIIGEVKEGVAKINHAMFQRTVMREALRRFGACERKEIEHTLDKLLKNGTAYLEDGTRVRLMAFASRPPDRRSPVPFTYVALSDAVQFLKGYIRAHWEIQNAAPFRDPVLRFLAMLEKGDNEFD